MGTALEDHEARHPERQQSGASRPRPTVKTSTTTHRQISRSGPTELRADKRRSRQADKEKPAVAKASRQRIADEASTTTPDINCYLIDNNGFIIVAEDLSLTGVFFGKAEGAVMSKLVSMGSFKRVNLYDYQAICRVYAQTSDTAHTLLHPYFALFAAVRWLLTELVIFLLEFNLYSWWYSDLTIKGSPINIECLQNEAALAGSPAGPGREYGYVSGPGSQDHEPDDQVVPSQRLSFNCIAMCGDSGNIHFKGGGRQPSLQHFLQEEKHCSDQASSGVLLVRRTTLNEQVPLQRIEVPRRGEVMVSTTAWGRSPRTSAPHPGTRHGVTRDLEASAIGPGRGCREEH
ncbi:unnamed protein product [Leuciscus chuanchicus]